MRSLGLLKGTSSEQTPFETTDTGRPRTPSMRRASSGETQMTSVASLQRACSQRSSALTSCKRVAIFEKGSARALATAYSLSTLCSSSNQGIRLPRRKAEAAWECSTTAAVKRVRRSASR